MFSSGEMACGWTASELFANLTLTSSRAAAQTTRVYPAALGRSAGQFPIASVASSKCHSSLA